MTFRKLSAEDSRIRRCSECGQWIYVHPAGQERLGRPDPGTCSLCSPRRP